MLGKNWGKKKLCIIVLSSVVYIGNPTNWSTDCSATINGENYKQLKEKSQESPSWSPSEYDFLSSSISLLR